MKTTTLSSANVPIVMWVDGVPIESEAIDQLKAVAGMPFVYRHVAVMPDVHVGRGATVGSVIATKGAVIPASVGVDIGCGMNAIRLSIKAKDLPTSLKNVRIALEEMIPVGFDEHSDDRLNSSVHRGFTPGLLRRAYSPLEKGLDDLVLKHPDLEKRAKDIFKKSLNQLGSLGGGNHFVELCIDENQDVWVMLHSGSRGVGNIIGSYFIDLAKKDMEGQQKNLPNKDLAYLTEGTSHFSDYVSAVDWAQSYARSNRQVMMDLALSALSRHLPPFTVTQEAINCHHNYLARENHFGEDVLVTRKGAVNAEKDRLGIIPGSMGAKSFIVRGKGNPESFHSCSHGAGRKLSRSKAKSVFTLEDHERATKGVECRKDRGVLDETPGAYKDIDKVMAAQEELIEVVHTLKQVLCIKG